MISVVTNINALIKVLSHVTVIIIIILSKSCRRTRQVFKTQIF
ncbi:F-box protein [Fulvivirga sp.]